MKPPKSHFSFPTSTNKPQVSVSIAYYSAFRARSNFTEPESFLPERWLDNEDPKFASDNRDVFQPFSYGPRNCLGQK